MAQDSKIQWCNHTANLWWGCTKVHEGCDHCYAETLSKRFGDDIWGNNKSRKQIKSVWNDLTKYQKLAKEANQIHRVFVGSMMDIFEKPMPLIDSKGNFLPYDSGELRDRLFNEVIPNSPNLLFLLLTKRPSNINKYIPEYWKTNPPTNVMFGTSPVNQQMADTLISQLLKVKGRKILSIEPMLDKISLVNIKSIYINNYHNILKPDSIIIDSDTTHISWVIVGGESGHGKRPFNSDWARTIRDQCKFHNVPFFMKQIDKIQDIPSDLLIREFPKL